jgi:hypothetical protein
MASQGVLGFNAVQARLRYSFVARCASERECPALVRFIRTNWRNESCGEEGICAARERRLGFRKD